MIKLSLPPFDPQAGLVFEATFYSYYYNKDLGRHVRGLRLDEQPDEKLQQVPFRFLVPDATNGLAIALPGGPIITNANPPAGPYGARLVLNTWHNGVDGTAGWFTIDGDAAEIVDIKVTYTPAGGESDRVAQGYFV